MKISLEYLENEELFERVVCDGLMKADTSLLIATANVKATTTPTGRGGKYVALPRTFKKLCSRGVDIKLLHSSAPSRPFARELNRCRLLDSPTFAMRLCPRVHFKAIVVDSRSVYLGSANLTGSGLGARAAERRNFEVGVVSDDKRLIERVESLFMAVWNGAMCSGCAGPGGCTGLTERKAEG